jgi:hypothetical protein
LNASAPNTSAPGTTIPGASESDESPPLSEEDSNASTSSDTGADMRLYTINFDGNGPFEVRVDIPLEEFRELYFDGEIWIQGADYDARSGSTILTIPEARLAKVADGSHTLRAVFDRQNVNIPFTLQRAASSGSGNAQTASGSARSAIANAAQTGSANKSAAPIILAAIAAALTVAGTIVVLRSRVRAVKH